MSDLATIDATAALDAAADPGEFVVAALERGKSWLAEALAHNDLDALVNMKGWAATLRTATMQKQLGKDAELAATELVRRAERCIGLGIRAGQEAGGINRRSDKAINYNPKTGDRVPVSSGNSKASPTDFATETELSSNGTGIYALTDDVSDAQFEDAINEAREEGNLSRANLVRHVKPDKVKPKPAERHEIHRKARRIDAERIIEESIAMLEGIASGLALIEDAQSLDAEKRLEWIEALRQPLAAITRFTKELRG